MTVGQMPKNPLGVLTRMCFISLLAAPTALMLMTMSQIVQHQRLRDGTEREHARSTHATQRYCDASDALPIRDRIGLNYLRLAPRRCRWAGRRAARVRSPRPANPPWW